MVLAIEFTAPTNLGLLSTREGDQIEFGHLGIVENDLGIRLALESHRANLRKKIEASGKILETTHFVVQYIQSIIQDTSYDLPSNLEVWVVDGDGKEMYYSPAANVVVVGRGFLKYIYTKSKQRFQETGKVSGLTNNPFAQLLSNQEERFVLTADHIAGVLEHEIRHGEQREEKEEKNVDIDFNLAQIIGDRHKNEYDADQAAIKNASKKYNPWAMIDLLWLLQYEAGIQGWSHPDVVDRIRFLENLLTDDETPFSNTTKKPTPVPDNVLAWIKQETTIYDDTDTLFSQSSSTLDKLIRSSTIVSEYLKLKSTWEHQRILEQSVWLSKQDRIKQTGLLGMILASADILRIHLDPTFDHEKDGQLLQHCANLSKKLKDAVDTYNYDNRKSDQHQILPEPTHILFVPEATAFFNQAATIYEPDEWKQNVETVFSLYKQVAEDWIQEIDRIVSTQSGLQPKLRMFLLEKKRLLELALENKLSIDDIRLILSTAYPKHDLKKVNGSTSSSNRKTYLRDRSERVAPPLCIDFDGAEESEIERALQTALIHFSSFIVDNPISEQHENILRTILRSSGFPEETIDYITGVILQQSENSTFFSPTQLEFPILKQLMIAVETHIPNQLPLTFSPGERHLGLRNSIQLLMMRTSLRCRYISGFSTNAYPARRALLSNNYGLLGLQERIQHSYYLRLTTNIFGKTAHYNDKELNPFGISPIMSIKEWRKAAQQNDRMKRLLDKYVVQYYLKLKKNDQEIDTEIKDYISGIDEIHFEINVIDLISLLNSNIWKENQLYELFYYFAHMHQQHYALTQDEQSLNFLISLQQKCCIADRDKVLQLTYGAMMYRKLSVDNDISFIHIFKETLQWFSKIGTPLRMSSLPFKEQRYVKNPSNADPKITRTDTFLSGSIQLLSAHSSEAILQLYRVASSIDSMNTSDGERFSFSEELLLVHLIHSHFSDSENRFDEIARFCHRGVRSYDAKKIDYDPIDIAHRVYQAHGEDSILWVKTNFQPSQERDELLAILSLETGNNQALSDINSIDNGTHHVDTTRYRFDHHIAIKDNVSKVDTLASVHQLLAGPGIIGTQYQNLLLRRHNFNRDVIYYANPYSHQIDIIEPGSYTQQVWAQQLLEKEDEILSCESFSQQVELITAIISSPCLVRDQYLEIVTRDAVELAKNHQEELILLESILPLLTKNSEYRERLAVRYLLLKIEHENYIWNDFESGLVEITTLFPRTSIARAHFLKKLSTSVGMTHQQAKQLKTMIAASEEDSILVVDNAVVAFDALAEISRQDKLKMLYWLLGISTIKPNLILEREAAYDGHLDDIPNFFASLLPEEQELILKRILLGEQGIFDTDSLDTVQATEANKQKAEALERIAELLFGSSGKESGFLKQVFVESLTQLPAASAATIFSKLLGVYFYHLSMGKEIQMSTMAGLFLVELSTPGIKAAQTISELSAVPSSYKQSLKSSQESAGKQMTIPALFSVLEQHDLTTPNQHGFYIESIDELLGDASNKQGAKMTIVLTDERLVTEMRLDEGYKRVQVVGRFKRPSSQKTALMDSFYEVGQTMLAIAAKHFGSNVPPLLVQSIQSATSRELDFEKERQFTEKLTAEITNVGKIHGIEINVPKIIFCTDNLIIETLAAGSSLLSLEESLPKKELKLAKIATVSILIYAMMEYGSVHVDPTLGNIFYDQTTKKLSILDRGMHEELNEDQRKIAIDLMLGLQKGSTKNIRKACRKFGWELPDVRGKFNGSFFNNVDALVQLVMYSEEDVPEVLNSLVFVLFKISVYFEGLTSEDMDKIVQFLSDKVHINVLHIIARMLL